MFNKKQLLCGLQTTLTQTQDKSLRRISELKEQTQLDYQAKKDLENNYQLMLDEKDEVIQVLRTQVRTVMMTGSRQLLW